MAFFPAKIEKNAKKMLQNLVDTKKCCIFASLNQKKERYDKRRNCKLRRRKQLLRH